jgi:excisionase family DNA binding protein
MKIRLLTTSEVARIFRCDRSTAARWCDDGRFEGAFKVGRAWLIPEPAVRQLLPDPAFAGRKTA